MQLWGCGSDSLLKHNSGRLSNKLCKKFGRMVGLWRSHAAIQESIQLMADKDFDHALAFLYQVSKALHQVAIDGGSWEQGALFLESENPLTREGFASEPEEVEGTHVWRRAMEDLRGDPKDGTPKEEVLASSGD